MLIRLKTRCSCETVLHDIQPAHVDLYQYLLAEKNEKGNIQYRFAYRPEAKSVRSFRRVDDPNDHPIIASGGVACYQEV